MRPHIREFLEKCAVALPCPEPIVEIGSYQVPGQEALLNLRPLFPGKRYTGCDMRLGPGVDRVEDIHRLTFADGEVGTFILADTLEHVSDPIRAMQEVYRCLREDGVVIFTSVMNFAIHGYPNDYWRFTPEAFRELSSQFSAAAIFYGGAKEFPNTVCGVAAKSAYSAAAIRRFSEGCGDFRVLAPMHVHPEDAGIVSLLAAKLVQSAAPAKGCKIGAFFRKLVRQPSSNALAGGFLGKQGASNWVLANGQWLEAWIVTDQAGQVEVVAGAVTIHKTTLNRPMPDLARKHGLSPEQPISFCEQVTLPAGHNHIGALELAFVDDAGKRQSIVKSAPGVVLGDFDVPRGLVLHSLDERGAAPLPAPAVERPLTQPRNAAASSGPKS